MPFWKVQPAAEAMVMFFQPVIHEQTALPTPLEIRSKRSRVKGLAKVQGIPLTFWA